ncbi:hypothetical protein GCM10025771_35670 [Niveibacterium umoris]
MVAEPIRIEATLQLPPVRHAAVEATPPKQDSRPEAHPKTRTARARGGQRREVLAKAPVVETQPSVADGTTSQPVESSSAAGADTVAKVPEAGAEKPVVDPVPLTVDPEATQAWPREGRIRYQVRYGETIEVGEMIHTWSHDGERYTMRSEASTSGLARLIKRFNGVQQSQGRVGPEGLAPTGFQEDLNGKQSHAVFDWAQRKVILSRPDLVREVPFVGLAQDILSLAHHLAFQPDGMEQTTLYVVGGRWGSEATLSQIANERLRLPWGSIEARHFHCEARNGEFIVDLWLSRQHRNAPVRVRVDDRKQGHVFDEVAREIELDGVKLDIQPSRQEKDSYKG